MPVHSINTATTTCTNDTLRNYGDVHGDADRFNEDVIKERGETTDSVFESTVETHQQEYNQEIEESQVSVCVCTLSSIPTSILSPIL